MLRNLVVVVVVVVVVVAVDLGFTTLLTSQVISVVLYIEREKSGKFCSEAPISAWGSFTCRKSTTRDPGFTSLLKEVILRIFTIWKNPSTPAGFEPANLASNGEYDNHWTIGADPAGNLTVAAGLEGRDSTNHVMATDKKNNNKWWR